MQSLLLLVISALNYLVAGVSFHYEKSQLKCHRFSVGLHT